MVGRAAIALALKTREGISSAGSSPAPSVCMKAKGESGKAKVSAGGETGSRRHGERQGAEVSANRQTAALQNEEKRNYALASGISQHGSFTGGRQDAVS